MYLNMLPKDSEKGVDIMAIDFDQIDAMCATVWAQFAVFG